MKKERLKYRRIEVFIEREDGKKKIKAYELTSPHKGLVVNKGEYGGWYITHKPSGLLVSYHSFYTMQEALQKVKQLYELSEKENFNWNKSREDLFKEIDFSVLEEKVKEII